MNYNGFPATYQPFYTPPYQQPQNNGLIWVQGEAGAKSYLVAPNTSVVLWDSEAQSIYIKSADASGMPSVKTLDYTVRQNGVNVPNSSVSANADNVPAYATKDEIKAVTDNIDKLKAQIEKLSKKLKERDEDDE